MEAETRNRDTCTSTGTMLTQVQSSLPEAFNFRRYPKYRTQPESREFPFSKHDNKQALMDVTIFGSGVGRRRSQNLRRQHSSHFCLCHEEASSGSTVSSGDVSAYKADFTVKQATDNVPGSGRRFPRNHRQKSADAASAQTEQFMWFGRHDSPEQRSTPSTSRPKDTLVLALLHDSA
ncbi:testis-expressed protein 36 isoform X2 [Nelusetta ayraudi]|uniref:testis-expressed protein 36 isoform X2 n=1 Tax=Nelusetta ayraudi TaxID=303726 RepID=UPI003F6ED22D